MATFIWDLVDPVELINYVRAYEMEMLRDDARFVLNRWLPDRVSDEIEFKVRQGGMDDVDVANFRAWDTPNPMTDRPGTSWIGGEIGPLGRQIPLSEEERIRRDVLLRGTNDRLVDQIFRDAERMVRSVLARVEMARGDLIDDGIVSIAENGLNLTADWGRSAGASPTAAVDWDQAGGTPLSDMLSWVEDYVDLNGFEPGAVVMAKARFSALALNPEMLDYMAANGTTPSRLNAQAVRTAWASEGLPDIVVYDGMFRVNGTRTRVLNENKVYLMPPPAAEYGETRWGPTAESTVLREKGLIEEEQAPGIVAFVTGNDHPVQTFVHAAATALPISPNPDYVFDCTVE